MWGACLSECARLELSLDRSRARIQDERLCQTGPLPLILQIQRCGRSQREQTLEFLVETCFWSMVLSSCKLQGFIKRVQRGLLE